MTPVCAITGASAGFPDGDGVEIGQYGVAVG
jgi:hypothetical protein